ncbi:MAG: DNA-3-methyladenine glycosylase 2 family protein [Proteobacteria bacterium]|nr:MAG: DNA-3-methyladenine glycosylase 2 family protein [Pseudomonadota bacterium]
MKREDTFYAAMLSRDARFDGKFFVAVKTTGIYCRPICPAKPKRENVEFFLSARAAAEAGYRPCLRCRPESAPASAAWSGKSAVVRRAVSLIEESAGNGFKDEAFAARLGMGARHLRRLFREELNITPKQLAAAFRLRLARKLLAETRLPIGQVAYASGFSSLRRFNDAFSKHHGRPPRQARKAGKKGEAIRLFLPYRPPFDFLAILNFYRVHQVGSLESFAEDSMERLVEHNGSIGLVEIRDAPERNCLEAKIDIPDLRALPFLLSRVRTMFDLDADPLILANAIGSDKKMKAILAKHPGVRLPSGWDGFEIGVGTILGQFVSLACARSLVHALVETLGEPVAFASGPRRLFPSPARVAGADLTFLKTTGARKETLRAFASAVAGGAISLSPEQDPETFRRGLLSLKGIGPWTANYMTLKILRHTDAFPETDLILARALEHHPLEELEALRPWRAYAAILLWLEYAEALKKKAIPVKRTKR